MFARWKHWFVNVFWYHYKVRALLTVFFVTAAALSLYAALANENPDFVLLLASERPVSIAQGQSLADFWTENVDGVAYVTCKALYLEASSQYAAANSQLLVVAMISDDHSIFILGESAAQSLSGHFPAFYTTAELGLPAGPFPETAPLDGVALMEELQLTQEPMFALVKRPRAGKDGLVKPKDAGRRDKTVECLRVLLGA